MTRPGITALAAALALTATAAPAQAGGKKVVTTARNATLHKTILVTTRGRTLYSLSAERHGRFICTDSACLSLWKPLTVPAGTTPTGASGLSTIKRPDGKRQVTSRGRPLYTFTDDRRAGDANGEGFKDVGTWHAAAR